MVFFGVDTLYVALSISIFVPMCIIQKKCNRVPNKTQYNSHTITHYNGFIFSIFDNGILSIFVYLSISAEI